MSTAGGGLVKADKAGDGDEPGNEPLPPTQLAADPSAERREPDGDRDQCHDASEEPGRGDAGRGVGTDGVLYRGHRLSPRSSSHRTTSGSSGRSASLSGRGPAGNARLIEDRQAQRADDVVGVTAPPPTGWLS